MNPPFDYVPASQEIYEAYLNDIAQQIINDLHGPDIIFIQEAEDQDICTVSAGSADVWSNEQCRWQTRHTSGTSNSHCRIGMPSL